MQWFSISIFFIQLFTVFIPCYQVYRDRHLRNETLAAIATWEAKIIALRSGVADGDTTQVESITDLTYSTSDDVEKAIPRLSPTDQISPSSVRKNYLYTMTAFECALEWNPTPLQKFAALKDFSGENISFLTHLASWKKSLLPQIQSTQRHSISIQPHQDDRSTQGDPLRDAYNRAISLYTVFVSQDHAEFPLDLSHRTLRRLDALFSRPANLLFGDASSQSTVNSATPFASERSKSVTMTDVLEVRTNSVATTAAADTPGVLTLDGVYYWGDIPDSFDTTCFDDAEQQIKYLVLTNTWPKFVNAGCAEMIRDAQGKTLSKRLTQHFFRKSSG